MKNVLKTFGLIALMAVIGFSMAACSDDGGGGPGGGGGGGGGGGNSLAGTTWKCTESYYGMSVTYTLTFTASRVTLAYNMMGASDIYNGTYTVNGNSVTMNWDQGWTGSASYTLNGNKLTDTEGHIFTKQ